MASSSTSTTFKVLGLQVSVTVSLSDKDLCSRAEPGLDKPTVLLTALVAPRPPTWLATGTWIKPPVECTPFSRRGLGLAGDL